MEETQTPISHAFDFHMIWFRFGHLVEVGRGYHEYVDSLVPSQVDGVKIARGQSINDVQLLMSNSERMAKLDIIYCCSASLTPDSLY